MVSKETLLGFIAKHDTKWGWYQVERMVNPRDLPPGKTVMGLLKELEGDGTIRQVPDEPMPRYSLTEQGRLLYQALITTAGDSKG